METLKTLEEIVMNPYFNYPCSIVLFTYLTLKFLFKASPKWFKEVVSLFWGVIFGVLICSTYDIKIMAVVGLFGFTVALYDKVLSRILKLKVDDGKNIFK